MASQSIYIVDDDFTIVRTLELALRQAGFGPILGFTDGVSAMKAVRVSPPAIVILDQDIKPSDRGYILAAEMRTIVPTLKVIAISGELDWSAWKPVNPDRVFKKPFDLAAIVAAVREELNWS